MIKKGTYCKWWWCACSLEIYDDTRYLLNEVSVDMLHIVRTVLHSYKFVRTLHRSSIANSLPVQMISKCHELKSGILRKSRNKWATPNCVRQIRKGVISTEQNQLFIWKFELSQSIYWFSNYFECIFELAFYTYHGKATANWLTNLLKSYHSPLAVPKINAKFTYQFDCSS